MSALTRKQRADLVRLEGVVTTGLSAFHEVGRALLEIRERLLYQETHSTWEAYLHDRWGFGDEWARLQMRGAEVYGVLEGDMPTRVGVEVLPVGEYQTRPLIGLSPELQQAAWASASATGQPTGAAVAAAVEQLLAEGDTAAREADRLEGNGQRYRAANARDARADRLRLVGHLLGRAARAAAGLGGEAEQVLGHVAAARLALEMLDA